jgi:hypothetical protein
LQKTTCANCALKLTVCLYPRPGMRLKVGAGHWLPRLARSERTHCSGWTSDLMWITPVLLVIGGWATLAWFGAQEPEQTSRRKSTYGFVALVSAITAIIASSLHG